MLIYECYSDEHNQLIFSKCNFIFEQKHEQVKNITRHWVQFDKIIGKLFPSFYTSLDMKFIAHPLLNAEFN